MTRINEDFRRALNENVDHEVLLGNFKAGFINRLRGFDTAEFVLDGPAFKIEVKDFNPIGKVTFCATNHSDGKSYEAEVQINLELLQVREC